MKNTIEPSSVRVVPVHDKLMLCFPYFFPIMEASVSAIIIIVIPAIGRYIWLGAMITKIVTKIVMDRQ